ncbi:MAG: RNA polymerase sigma factor [Planctomycetota bacterium]
MDQREQLEKLTHKYYDRLFRAAQFMCGDEEVAEDLVQDTFLGAMKSLDNFKGNSSHYTWLYGILLNKFRGWLRKKDRNPQSLERKAEGPDSPDRSELFEGDAPEASEELIKKERADKVRAAIDDLPAHHRSVLVLRYIEDMSYREIAEQVDCSLGTVKSRIHYALKKVGKGLEESKT